MNLEKGTRVLYQALPQITCVGLGIFLAFYHFEGPVLISESLVSDIGDPKENNTVFLPSSDTWADQDVRFIVHFNTVLGGLGVGERLPPHWFQEGSLWCVGVKLGRPGT